MKINFDIGHSLYGLIYSDVEYIITPEEFYKQRHDTREFYEPTGYNCFIAGYKAKEKIEIDLLNELYQEAQKLILSQDANEISEGYGMFKVIDALKKQIEK